MRTPAVLVAVAVAVAPSLCAQRHQAAIEHQKHEVVIDHGVPKVGKHSLEDLQVGTGVWRLGMDDATTLRCAIPLVAGDLVVAPGSYRVQVARPAQDQLTLDVEGAGLALGASAPNVRIPGPLTALAKATKELQIEWLDPKVGGETKDATLRVQFGGTEWRAPFTMLGARGPGKLAGWVVETFTWSGPALQARRDAGKATPIATLIRKGKGDAKPEHWNLVVTGTHATLIPWLVAPVDSFGFGPVVPPDAALVVAGSIVWAEIKTAPLRPVLELTSAPAPPARPRSWSWCSSCATRARR